MSNVLKLMQENFDEGVNENHRFCLSCKAIIPNTSDFMIQRAENP